jgi:hypothetical protein
MIDFSDDERILALHPLVRRQTLEGNRDKPLTLNWLPAESDAYDCLGLPRLTPRATVARAQILTEALVTGPDQWTSYSRRKQAYTRGQRYYRPTYTYNAIVPAVDQLASEGFLDHEKMPQGHRGYQSRFRASDLLLDEIGKVPVLYRPLEILILRDADGDLADYRDTPLTKYMRRSLSAINEALVSQEIGLSGRIIREDRRSGQALRNRPRLRLGRRPTPHAPRQRHSRGGHAQPNRPGYSAATRSRQLHCTRRTGRPTGGSHAESARPKDLSPRR